MPIYRVQTPDGRIIQVEGPEGAPEEEILAFAEANDRPATEPAPAAEMQAVDPLTGAPAGSIPVVEPIAATPAGTADLAVPDQSMRGQTDVVPDARDSDFLRGVGSGYQNMVGMFGGLAGLVGDTVGNENLRQWGLDVYQNRADVASRIAPPIQTLDDINSLGDFFDAAQGWLGSSVPFLATTVAGGGVGGAVGRRVAQGAITRMVEKGVSKELAERAVKQAMQSKAPQILSAIKRGAMTGSFGASALTQQGGLYGELTEAGIEDPVLASWGFGAVQGALDIIPELMVLKKLMPNQVKGELSKTLARGLAGTIAKQAPTEAVTEGAQQALSALARITSGGASWSEQDTQDVLTNMAAGAVVGTVIGAGAELAGRAATRRNVPDAAVRAQDDMRQNFGTIDIGEAEMRPEGEARDYSSQPPRAAQMMVPEARARYLDWLNRSGSQEQQNAYEEFMRSQPGETDEVILDSATVLGQRGEPNETATPWKYMRRAQQNADMMDGSDPAVARYRAQWFTAEQAAKRGLTGGEGAYVLAIPTSARTTDSEMVRAKGSERPLTYSQAARAGFARARSKFTALGKERKESGQYGITFERDGETATLDARELVQLGLDVEPDLHQSRNRGEQLARALEAGMAAVVTLGWQPQNASASGLSNVLVSETRGRTPMTFGQALSQYNMAVTSGLEDSFDATAPRDTPQRDAAITADRPDDAVPVSDEVPVAERGLEAAGDPGSVSDTEAAQNRSSVVSSQRGAQQLSDEVNAGRAAEFHQLREQIIAAGRSGRPAPASLIRSIGTIVRSEIDALSEEHRARTRELNQQRQEPMSEQDRTMLRSEIAWLQTQIQQLNNLREELLNYNSAPDKKQVLRNAYTFINYKAKQTPPPAPVAQRLPTDRAMPVEPQASNVVPFRQRVPEPQVTTQAASGNINDYTDEQIEERRRSKDEAETIETLDTPEKILGHVRRNVEAAERGENVWLNLDDADPFGGLRATPRQKLEMRGLVSRYRAAHRNPAVDTDQGPSPAPEWGGSRDSATKTQLVGIAQSLQRILGIKAPLYLADSASAASTSALLNGDMDVARRIESWIESGKRANGFHVAGKSGRTYIYVDGELNDGNQMFTVAHEVGHAFYKQYFDGAPLETKQALWTAFNNYVKNDRYNTWTDDTGNMLSKDRRFEEFMADQLAAWLASDKRPQTLVEKFFDGLVQALRRAWQTVVQQVPLTPEFDKFVNDVITANEMRVGDALDTWAQEDAELHENQGLAAALKRKAPDFLDNLQQKRPVFQKSAKHARNLWGVAATNFLRSMQALARRPKVPAINKLVDFFDLRPGQAGGYSFFGSVERAQIQYHDAFRKIVKDMSQEQINALHDELQMERDAAQAPAALREKVTQYRQLMARMLQYQRNAALPVQEQANYFSIVGDKEQLLAPGAAEEILRTLQLANVKVEGRDVQLSDVVAYIDNFADDGFAVEVNPDRIALRDSNFSDPFVQSLRNRVLPKEWHAAVRSIRDNNGKSKYYAKDLNDVFSTYNFQVTRRAEFNKILGDTTWQEEANRVYPQGDSPRKYNPMLKFQEHLVQAKKEGAHDDHIAYIENEFMPAMMGTYGRIKSESARKLNNAVLTYMNISKMMFVLLASLPDLANVVVRSGNLKTAWAGLSASMRQITQNTKGRDEMLRFIGYAQDMADQGILNNVLNDPAARPGAHNSLTGKVNEVFFRAVGMHAWTKFMRGLALNTGIEHLNTASDADLAELGVSREDVNTWNGMNQVMYGQPGYTLEEAQERAAAGHPPLASTEQLEALKRVNGALYRFIGDIVIHPAAPEKAKYMNAEKFKVFGQFKSFMYGYHSRVLSRVWHQLQQNGLMSRENANIAAWIGISLATTALGLELRNMIRGIGDDKDRKEKDGFEYFVHLVSRSGALGVASMGVDIYESSSGGRAPLVAMLGPAPAQINDAFQYGFAHAVAGGVPIVAQFPGLRDGLKDALR